MLINCFALSPVPGTKYAYYIATIGKSHSENAALDLAETEITLFGFAVSEEPVGLDSSRAPDCCGVQCKARDAHGELSLTGSWVFGYDAARISEGILGQRKRYSVLFLIFDVLIGIPLKADFLHKSA